MTCYSSSKKAEIRRYIKACVRLVNYILARKDQLQIKIESNYGSGIGFCLYKTHKDFRSTS